MAVVVFLRGMNLGSRRITNDDLAAAFGRLGFTDPTPYQASGNVILPDVDVVDAADLSAGLTSELGYEVPVFVRTEAELEKIAASPLNGESGAEGGKAQIVFLQHAPESDLNGVFRPTDRFEPIGNEIHWLPAGGMADSGDVQKGLDTVFGPTTVRTLGTVQRLMKKLAG